MEAVYITRRNRNLTHLANISCYTQVEVLSHGFDDHYTYTSISRGVERNFLRIIMYSSKFVNFKRQRKRRRIISLLPGTQDSSEFPRQKVNVMRVSNPRTP